MRRGQSFPCELFVADVNEMVNCSTPSPTHRRQRSSCHKRCHVCVRRRMSCWSQKATTKVPNCPSPGVKQGYQSIQTSRSSHSDGWNPMVRLTSSRTLEQRAAPDVDWRPPSDGLFSRTIRDIWDDVATGSWTRLPQIPPNSRQGPTRYGE